MVNSSVLYLSASFISDFYEETPNIPAYLNDSRFDHIELPWLANYKPTTNTSKKIAEDAAHVIINYKDKSKILISKGIMSTRDLFLVKSIEDYCSEATLLWFIESLKSKSVTDRFHKSCLASNIFQDNETNEVKPFDAFDTNYYLQLVVLNKVEKLSHVDSSVF